MSGNILAVVEPDRAAEATIGWAAGRCIERRARLVVICVWSRPRLSALAVLGWADLAELDREVGCEADSRIRTLVSALPSGVILEFVCRQGPLERELPRELSARHYGELVVAPGCLSRRLTDKLVRLHPELRIVLVARDEDGLPSSSPPEPSRSTGSIPRI